MKVFCGSCTRVLVAEGRYKTVPRQQRARWEGTKGEALIERMQAAKEIVGEPSGRLDRARLRRGTTTVTCRCGVTYVLPFWEFHASMLSASQQGQNLTLRRQGSVCSILGAPVNTPTPTEAHDQFWSDFRRFFGVDRD